MSYNLTVPEAQDFFLKYKTEIVYESRSCLNTSCPLDRLYSAVALALFE
jgi:hypothetical protein